MVNLSYNLSSLLREHLQKIESLRHQILLVPMSPRTEMHFRWEALINRVYWSLNLSENPLSKKEIIEILSAQRKKISLLEQEVIRYKNGLDYILQEWLVSTRPITPQTVLSLHAIACPGRLRSNEKNLKRFLNYFQNNPEHPVIQSAIAYIQAIDIAPFTDGNGRVARLLIYLFLYKYGYDFRGLLVLEEYWRRDLTTWRQGMQEVLKGGNLTLWLEFFTQGVALQLEKVTQDLASLRFKLELSPSFWELNNRQKDILSALENPDTSISNKKVQKLFKISQITASRDLAKLTSLGLLFPHGKGRSTYYTRI